jgi:cardiolipin synthase
VRKFFAQLGRDLPNVNEKATALEHPHVNAYRMGMSDQRPVPEFPGTIFHADGHDIRMLSADQDKLAGVLNVIGTAKKSVQMFSYMFGHDATGHEVLSALIAAAARGVSVQLIIDSFGSNETSNDFFAPLVAAGGSYHCFGSRWNLGYVVRNHQKILIADHHHAVIGGFNITDYYVGRAGDKSWEDFGIILSGPKVLELSRYYQQLAEMSHDGGVKFRVLRRVIAGWKPGNGTIQWLLGGPTNRISPWALRLKNDLQIAQKLHIVSAYFSPSQSILRRIAKVTRVGSSVIVLAGKTDNGATIGAARFLYSYLLKRGARIYEFQTRPLHMKLLVIDDACYIGSSNLDTRSLFINMEIMVRIHDRKLADHLRGIVLDMVEHSTEQTQQLHDARNGLFRRAVWLFNYILVNTVDYSIGRRIKFGLMFNRKSVSDQQARLE